MKTFLVSVPKFRTTLRWDESRRIYFVKAHFFLLFENHLSDFILADVYMCLNSQCEVYPLVNVQQHCKRQKEGTESRDESVLAAFESHINCCKANLVAIVDVQKHIAYRNIGLVWG